MIWSDPVGNRRRGSGSGYLVTQVEVEKALGGAAEGGSHDSGVGSRMFGALLTWLNDHESDIFFIATSNDVSRLPKEFTRAERFDGIFFLDQPAEEARKQIWDLYRAQYSISKKTKLPADEGWTGAEIKSCCRLAHLLDVSLEEAADQVVPVSIVAEKQIASLRSWANNRCLDAETGKRYSAGHAVERAKVTKKVTKKATKKSSTRKRGLIS